MHVKWNVQEIAFSQNNILKVAIEYLSHYYCFMHIKMGCTGTNEVIFLNYSVHINSYLACFILAISLICPSITD